VTQTSDDFDPDAPADAEGGLFGLSPDPAEARVHVLGVPFDATTSYRKGTARGPEAVLRASHQVDLLDLQQRGWRGGDGRPWRAGIHFELDEEVARWNAEAAAPAAAILERGGRIGDDAHLLEALQTVDALGARLNERTEAWTAERLREGRVPMILGGDHSVPFGAIRAAAAAAPGLGLLHFDAHADLRPAFEGFRWSHASIVHNLLEEAPGLDRVLSVGLRDLGEVAEAREHEGLPAGAGYHAIAVDDRRSRRARRDQREVGHVADTPVRVGRGHHEAGALARSGEHQFGRRHREPDRCGDAFAIVRSSLGDPSAQLCPQRVAFLEHDATLVPRLAGRLAEHQAVVRVGTVEAATAKVASPTTTSPGPSPW
jgi:arginase family enzyme